MAHPFLVGRLDEEDPTRKDVVLMSSEELLSLSGYDNLAITTLDGLFRPVSKTGDGGLPKFMTPDTALTGSGQIYQSHAPIPPFFSNPLDISGSMSSAGFINVNYLDPLSDPISNTGGFWSDNKVSGTGSPPHSGFDIEGVARSTNSGIDQTSGVFTIRDTIPTGSGYISNSSGVGYTGDYRFMALKGPLVMHGWGYDTMGLPVPNAIGDVDGEIDNFYTGKANRFQENFLADATKWPVATIDLRLDRKRGMWVSPPSFKLISVEASGTGITTGTYGFGTIVDSSGLYDASGVEVGTGIVEFYNNSANHTIVSGEVINLHYDVNEGRLVPYNLPSRSNGIIKATADVLFSASTASFNATVTRGNIGGYLEGDTVLVENYFGDDGGVGTKCHVYVDSVAGIAELVRVEC